MSGDILARGARKATFGPVKFCSQEKWESIFGDYEPKTPAEQPLNKYSSALEKAARNGKK